MDTLLDENNKVIKQLVEELMSDDGTKREHARNKLVKIGQPAVSSLIELAKHDNDQHRWEAIKALVDLSDISAMETFLQSLEDPNSGIRWLGAEGLINLKDDAIQPMLKRLLLNHKQSYQYRQGVHHVLTEFNKNQNIKEVHDLIHYLKSPLGYLIIPHFTSRVISKLEQKGILENSELKTQKEKRLS